MEKAPRDVIEKRAAERIEELKGELQQGLIGPRELDGTFSSTWSLAYGGAMQTRSELADTIVEGSAPKVAERVGWR